LLATGVGNNTYMGSMDEDLDGCPHIVDGGSGTATVDIGAYEFQP